VFLVSPVSAETLLRFYSVRRSSYEDILRIIDCEIWVGEVKLKREFDFYYTDIVLSDTPGLVNSIGDNGGICISVPWDPGLKMVFATKAFSLLGKVSRYNNEYFRVQGRELQKRLSKIVLGTASTQHSTIYMRTQYSMIGEE